MRTNDTGKFDLKKTPCKQNAYKTSQSNRRETSCKADFQSVKFSERAEILLFTRENFALKLNRLLRLSNISLSKIPPARDIPLTGN